MNIDIDSPNFSDFLELFVQNYYTYIKNRINASTDVKDIFIKLVQKNEGILNNVEVIFINYIVECKIQMSYEYFRRLQENKHQIHLYVFYLLCINLDK